MCGQTVLITFYARAAYLGERLFRFQLVIPGLKK